MSTNKETEDLDLGAALAAAMDSVDEGNPAPEAPPVEHENVDHSAEKGLEQAASGQDEGRANADDSVLKDDKSGQEAAAQDHDDARAAVTEEKDVAPSSWKPDIAQKWGELPEEVRAEIQRREADYHRGIEQYKQDSAIAQQVQQTIAPYMANIQAAGVHPLKAAAELFHADHILRNGAPEQKAQFLAKMARDYGIDLSQVQPLPPLDPQVQALLRQNQQLQQFQQNTLQGQQQAVMSEIEAFRANPANTHFETVKDDMAVLLQTGRAESLQDAYDKAVWMRPDIRQTLVQKQSANAQQQQAEAARRRRAQSAAGGVKGSAPSKTTPTQQGDLRDTLEAAWDGDL